MFIDSHAHITSEQFKEDRDAVIQRAMDAGVRYIINPATDLEDSRRAIALAEKHTNVYACVGFHPHDAKKAGAGGLEEMEELSKHPKVVAVGEIGLDFHYDFSPRDVQERVFRQQIAIAARRNLPIIIHTRDSIQVTMAVIREAVQQFPAWRNRQVTTHSRLPAPKGVFHCYSGDTATAWEAIHLGFCVSFPGVVTFKNAGLAAEVAAQVPVDHFLLETDSPYLAPVPYRGTRNEPMHIPLIARKLADLQHLTPEDVANATNHNAFRLFGIGDGSGDQ